jgi:hypothetical protein
MTAKYWALLRVAHARSPACRFGVSSKLTRRELLIASVSEKNLQSIKAMGKVSPPRGNG